MFLLECIGRKNPFSQNHGSQCLATFLEIVKERGQISLFSSLYECARIYTSIVETDPQCHLMAKAQIAGGASVMCHFRWGAVELSFTENKGCDRQLIMLLFCLLLLIIIQNVVWKGSYGLIIITNNVELFH